MSLDLEKASAQIDTLIERRAREREQANWESTLWAESVRRYNFAARAERRRQWWQYHTDMAAIHTRIATEHTQKAARLASEAEEGAQTGLIRTT